MRTPNAQGAAAEVRGESGLPACAVQEDEELVADATARIKDILGKTLQRGLEEVGEYVFETFYNGDPEAYFSSNPHKHVSLRLLLDRCGTVELPVAKAWLARAVQMAVMIRRLPKGSRFLALPSSHRVELLKLKSVDKVEQLAMKAHEGNLTVQRLRETVNKEAVRTKSSRGRKPIPLVIRTLNLCVRSLRDSATGKLSLRRDDVDSLTEEQVEEARVMAELLSKRVGELLKLLG